MSKLSDLFHKSKTLEPDSIEERYIKELEADKAELLNSVNQLKYHITYEQKALALSIVNSILNKFKGE